MSERLNPRRIVAEARAEANALGSHRVEAEHLLLALSLRPDLDAGRLLADRGLDHETLRRALGLEFERSLAAVGIRLDGFALPAPGSALGRDAHALGQSVKLCLQRALQSRAGRGRDRHLGSLNLLLGILTPPSGTVARALAAIDVDRDELAAIARTALEQAA